MLEKTKGGLVAGIGIAVLFWTVIRVLGNIEKSFNFIWGVKKHRSFGRKLSDYLSMMLICPIFLVLSSSTTVYIASQIENITANIELFSGLDKFILLLLRVLPYCSLWLVFSFVFIFMPNTRVKFKSGILAGKSCAAKAVPSRLWVRSAKQDLVAAPAMAATPKLSKQTSDTELTVRAPARSPP